MDHPTINDYDQAAKHYGMTRRDDHSLWLEPGFSEKRGRKLPKRTEEDIAACRAAGLSFWSEHPKPNRLWAVDEHQQPHVVVIDRKRRIAVHDCHPYDRYPEGSRCADRDGLEHRYYVNITDTSLVAGAPVVSRVPEKLRDKIVVGHISAPVQDTPPQPGMTLDAAIAQINHDPEYLVGIPTDHLNNALGKTDHDGLIAEELNRRKEAS